MAIKRPPPFSGQRRIERDPVVGLVVKEDRPEGKSVKTLLDALVKARRSDRLLTRDELGAIGDVLARQCHQLQQARSQAIDDCIKVVTVEIARARDIVTIVAALEALKGST